MFEGSILLWSQSYLLFLNSEHPKCCLSCSWLLLVKSRWQKNIVHNNNQYRRRCWSRRCWSRRCWSRRCCWTTGFVSIVNQLRGSLGFYSDRLKIKLLLFKIIYFQRKNERRTHAANQPAGQHFSKKRFLWEFSSAAIKIISRSRKRERERHTNLKSFTVIFFDVSLVWFRFHAICSIGLQRQTRFLLLLLVVVVLLLLPSHQQNINWIRGWLLKSFQRRKTRSHFLLPKANW